MGVERERRARAVTTFIVILVEDSNVQKSKMGEEWRYGCLGKVRGLFF